MRNNLEFPQSKTDPGLVNPWDFKLFNRYFYFTINCTRGVEDNMYWGLPTIRSFYLRPVQQLRSWWKEHWRSNDTNKSPLPESDLYHLAAAIFDTNSSRLNDSPLTIMSPLIKPSQELSILGERQRQTIEITRGRTSFFSSGKKHFYIYPGKKECVIGLISRVEKEIDNIKKSYQYISNQLYGLMMNPISSPKTSLLPSSIKSGETVWIARYDSSDFYSYSSDGEQTYHSLNTINFLPTPIILREGIADWERCRYVYSDNLINDAYSPRVILGRTEEECYYKYYKTKEDEMCKLFESLKGREKSFTEKLEKLKKSLEKL